MKTITVPKKLSDEKDLVVLPRREYEEFYRWQKSREPERIYMPTASERKELKKAREEYKKGNYITLEQLERELGITHKKKG